MIMQYAHNVGRIDPKYGHDLAVYLLLEDLILSMIIVTTLRCPTLIMHCVVYSFGRSEQYTGNVVHMALYIWATLRWLVFVTTFIRILQGRGRM